MRQQSGFSLVELMVGALIGIIGMMLILQTQENFDKNKRALSSGGDAQVSGAVAAFQVERSLRNAGMGFGGSPHLGCTVNAKDNGTVFTFPLVAVRIIDGGTTGPDEIQVLSGNSTSPSSTYVVQSSDADQTLLDSRGGLDVNDLVVLASPPATGCRLLHLSAVTAPDATVNPLVLHAAGFGRYSGSTAITLTFLAANSTLHNLGKAPTLTAWTVRNNNLVTANRMSDHNTNSWGDVVDGVVDLQAQYGVDINNDTRIDALDDDAGTDTVNGWTSTDPADWSRVYMVRFALLIRSQDRENTAVTTTAPSWAGGTFVMRNVDGTADSGATGPAANNWRYFRYQVQEVVVPLRNMIWRN